MTLKAFFRGSKLVTLGGGSVPLLVRLPRKDVKCSKRIVNKRKVVDKGRVTLEDFLSEVWE